MLRKTYIIFITMLIFGCTGLPEGIQPVKNFQLQKYLGTWYEIARLDHSFERDLQQVSAQYNLREDGGINVTNRGFNVSDSSWSKAEGKAYFVQTNDTGYLKVSFFGPFYGSYVIFDLDPDYQYAFVTSSSRDYLWFLSRTPLVSQQLKDTFVEKSKALGFTVDEIIWVKQKN